VRVAWSGVETRLAIDDVRRQSHQFRRGEPYLQNIGGWPVVIVLMLRPSTQPSFHSSCPNGSASRTPMRRSRSCRQSRYSLTGCSNFALEE
jgi:hypothetical protein